jgi:hypothetical protein
MESWTDGGDIRINFPGCAEWKEYNDRSAFDAALAWIVDFDKAEHARAKGLRGPRPSADLGVLPADSVSLVVELKDPANPRARPEQRIRFLQEVIEPTGQFARKRLIPAYRTAAEFLDWLRGESRRYAFILLIETPSDAGQRLDAAGASILLTAIEQAMTENGVAPRAALVLVLDLPGWNSRFPQYPAFRVPVQGGQA